MAVLFPGLALIGMGGVLYRNGEPVRQRVRIGAVRPVERPREPAPDPGPAAVPTQVLPTETAPSFPSVLDRFSGTLATLPFATLLEIVRFFAGSSSASESIRAELDRWEWGPDPQAQNRASALRALVDGGWEQAAFFHPDPRVRALLMDSPPRPAERSTQDRLVEVALRNPSPEVRAAALRGLPADLDNEAAASLAPCLLDADSRVVATAARVLRSARELDPAARAALQRLSTGGEGEAAEEARRTLARFSRRDRP